MQFQLLQAYYIVDWLWWNVIVYNIPVYCAAIEMYAANFYMETVSRCMQVQTLLWDLPDNTKSTLSILLMHAAIFKCTMRVLWLCAIGK